jgi:hypothetical protein
MVNFNLTPEKLELDQKAREFFLEEVLRPLGIMNKGTRGLLLSLYRRRPLRPD